MSFIFAITPEANKKPDHGADYPPGGHLTNLAVYFGIVAIVQNYDIQ